MKTQPVLWSMGVLMLAGCASSQRPEEPSPVPVTVPSMPTPQTRTSASSWTIQPVEGAHRYRSTVLARITEEGSSVLDSMKNDAVFLLSINRGLAPALITATIESFVGQGDQSQLPRDPLLPYLLTGHYEGSRISLDSSHHSASTPYPCGAGVSAGVTALQQSIVLPPLQMRTSTSWTDTVSSTACTGLIPVRSTVIRSYRVLGEAGTRGTPALTIRRNDQISFAGEGSLEQHRVSLAANGSGETMLSIDPTSGVLLESRGSHSLNLAVVTSGRRRIFHQQTETKIVQTLRPLDQ